MPSLSCDYYYEGKFINGKLKFMNLLHMMVEEGVQLWLNGITSSMRQ